MANKQIREIAEQLVEQYLNESDKPKYVKMIGYKKTLKWVGDKVENTDWNIDKVRAEAAKAGHDKDHVERAIDHHTR